MNVVPLQLKLKNFYGEILSYAGNNRMMPIHGDDKELFRKCREMWNKITELIGITLEILLKLLKMRMMNIS